MNLGHLALRSCGFALIALTVLSCTKPEKENSNNSNSPSISAPGTAQCGVVIQGALKNPVKPKDGESVTLLGATGANLIIAANPKTPKNPFLVKLHGVGAARNKRKQQEAIAAIKLLSKGGGFFFKPFPMCQTYLGRELVAVGTIITAAGININEYVIQKGFALPERQDVCNGLLLDACYQALSEENATAGGIGCKFLWKPVADKDGKAVIHADRCNTRIFVNGEEFQDAGSGNGRCSTARGSKPGCAYGQATIQVFDKTTGLPYEFPGGQTKLVVNGCSRVEPPCYE
jgi:hypothetical protein